MPTTDYARNEAFTPLLSYMEQLHRTAGATASALIVLQKGSTIAQWKSGAHHHKSGARPIASDSLFNVYSVRKTYIGLALAIALAENDIDPDNPVSRFISDMTEDELGSLSVKDLALKRGPKHFGEKRLEKEGLIGKIVFALTGRTIARLLTETVLDPLGFAETSWAAVPHERLVCDYTSQDRYPSVRIESDEGHERNLYVSARDLARWGQLHIENGFADGRPIVSEKTFELINELKRTAPAGKPAFGWHSEDGLFQVTGYTGCHVTVLPSLHAVGVRMLNNWDLPGPFVREDYDNEIRAFNNILIHCLKQTSL
ncbi:serine hydrolase domain-containing protein [Paenibacillus ginsengarvi]|nr:serine hydrolase domain-containing protein [Paenibacillus ginsengarvi]